MSGPRKWFSRLVGAQEGVDAPSMSSRNPDGATKEAPGLTPSGRGRALRPQRASELAPDVTVTTHAHEENPAAALVAASKDADLLVVGTRGLGGFKGLLLGSVGQQCVTHAHCSVMIVR